jgi:hypothetical protein
LAHEIQGDKHDDLAWPMKYKVLGFERLKNSRSSFHQKWRKMVCLSPLASPATTWRDKVTARPPLTPTGGPRETVEHGGLGAGRGTSRSILTYSGFGDHGGARVTLGSPETDSTSTSSPALPLLRLRNQHHHHRSHHRRLHHHNHHRHQTSRNLLLRRQSQSLRLALTLTR